SLPFVFTTKYQAGEHSEKNTSQQIFIGSRILILKRDHQKAEVSNPIIYSI
ncbi:MAG: hypothetical protein ACI9C4_002363, partial [Paraglaciecola sp.]